MNVRQFQDYGVKGVFEQGAYARHGAEMAELRAWVLAQLLWNPQQDDRALIKEFLRGYYGRKAGDILERYLALMYDASKGFNLRCYLGKDPPHLRFQPLAAAERLWQQAEEPTQRTSKLGWMRRPTLTAPTAWARWKPVPTATSGWRLLGTSR